MHKYILNYAKNNFPVALKLSNLVTYQKRYNEYKNCYIGSNFVHHEIKTRLAQRVKELSRYDCLHNITNLYVKSFTKLNNIDCIESQNDITNFVSTLEQIKYDHNYVALDISRSLRNLYQNEFSDEINKFLDKFYMSRIGLRTIIGNYVSVHKNGCSIVQDKCYPYKVIKDAIFQSREMCDILYNVRPKIDIIGPKDFTFRYIPSHLFYITLELIKNSMKSVIMKNKYSEETNIKIYISKGSDDLIIKISDFGGGFSRNKLDQVFSYGYTTEKNIPTENNKVVLSGFGHGVPLSRLYCRYFGGDLQLIPFDGIGTDAIIYINRLESANENLI